MAKSRNKDYSEKLNGFLKFSKSCYDIEYWMHFVVALFFAEFMLPGKVGQGIISSRRTDYILI